MWLTGGQKNSSEYGSAVVETISFPSLQITQRAPLSEPRETQGCSGVSLGGPWNTIALAPGGNVSPGLFSATLSIQNETSLNETMRLGQARRAIAYVSTNYENHTISAFAGGMYTTGSLPSSFLELFNHTSGELFVSNTTLSISRGKACAAALGRYIFIIGGTNNNIPYSVVDVIDVVSKTRIHVLNLAVQRYCCAAAALGPYIYVGGGHDQSAGVFRDSVEIIDTRSMTIFNATEPLSAPRGGLGVSVTPQGVFFIGGLPVIPSQYSLGYEGIDYYTCGNSVLHRTFLGILFLGLRIVAK